MTLTHVPLDTTYYPEDDDVSENMLEVLCRILLVPLLRRYLEARGTPMFVGASQFIYWKMGDASQALSPDIYVVPGLPPHAVPGSIKTWELPEEGRPNFAIEIVSLDKKKDYERAPLRYGEMGIQELVIYDPSFVTRPSGKRFQVYRRQPDEELALVASTNGGRVESGVLGCFLREVIEDGSQRLRLGMGPRGEELVPTQEEAERAAKEAERAAKQAALRAKRAAEKKAAAERAAKEAERAAKEAAEKRAADERAAKEAERAAKEAAQERIRQLEALLAEQTRNAKG